MSKPRLCAGPMCSNMEDPRWGGFCDGCGVSSEEEALSLKQRYRETNAIVRQLLDDIREHLWDCGPPANGAGCVDRGRDGDRQALLKRINDALEPQPQTEVSVTEPKTTVELNIKCRRCSLNPATPGPLGFLCPSCRPTVDIERRLTNAVRTADQAFEKVGGSTRHFVRDCLLPALEAGKLEVRSLTETPPVSATPPELKKGCNQHVDCLATKAKNQAEGRATFCCHDQDCEDCFGT